jgi:hypothetical protein
MKKEIIEAVAQSWASIDGKLEQYLFEKADATITYDSPLYIGTYNGYYAEAEELIRRLNKRGYTITEINK